MHRFSTNETDRNVAQSIANQKKAKYEAFAELGHKTSATGKAVKDFGDLCRSYAETLDEALRHDHGKPIYNTYIQILENWMIPYFANVPLLSVDDDEIYRFEKYRLKRLGREPAKSTINQHNTVLRGVFAMGVRKRQLTRSQLPILTVKNKGVSGKRRPDFSLVEYRQLSRFMRLHWARQTDGRFATRYKKKLLTEYVIFLISTGLRPGKEALALTWSCIEEDMKTSKGEPFVRIWVLKGKRGARRTIARAWLKDSLNRLRSLTNQTGPDDLLFCMPDGSEPSDLSAMFGRLLEEAGMRQGRDGDNRTLYSLRHSYATFRIESKNKPRTHEELAQMMGTSHLMIERHYAHLRPERIADDYVS